MKLLPRATLAIVLLSCAPLVTAQERKPPREGNRSAEAAGDQTVQAQERGRGQGGGGQQGDGQRGGQGRGGRGGGGGLFSLLDVDGDGQLSPREINGAIAVLAKLDVNKDGVLDAQELRVRGTGGGGGQGGMRRGKGPGGGKGGQVR